MSNIVSSGHSDKFDFQPDVIIYACHRPSLRYDETVIGIEVGGFKNEYASFRTTSFLLLFRLTNMPVKPYLPQVYKKIVQKL